MLCIPTFRFEDIFGKSFFRFENTFVSLFRFENTFGEGVVEEEGG